MEQETTGNIYIVLTQTGTILSQILKKFTGAKYNHVSIATDKDLTNMYSFGRLHAYNPFVAGFVKESTESGTFKRFKKTEAMILTVKVSDEQYHKICNYLNSLYNHKKAFGYNYKGVFMAFFGKVHAARNRFYCSEFVKNALVKAKIVSAEEFPAITQPIFFSQLFDDVIYKGRLSTYAALEH